LGTNRKEARPAAGLQPKYIVIGDVIGVEIKINREVRDYHETIFFGLSARQFFCSLCAVSAAVGLYFLLKDTLGKEVTGWVCMLGAVPLAAAGFFSYNGLPLEKFLWAAFKTTVFAGKRRVYRSENQYDVLIKASANERKWRKNINENSCTSKEN
ncbi:MAG: PrgI family protein, partial [Oscillospiraceae bacterium]